MSLSDIQVGDFVVKELKGGGFTTHSIVVIESVNEKGIFIEGCDGDFSDDSVYGYTFDGKPFSSFTTGFSSKLLRKATEEDYINYSEDY